MRIFAAIRPPESVVDHLELSVTNLRLGVGATLRWVPSEQRHITLAFHGEVPDGAVPEIAESLTEVAARHEPLELRLHGAGTFSSRTLWIGVAGDVAPLARLMADCAPAGEVDAGPHGGRRAHLTVARGSNRSRGVADLDGMARALAIYDGPTWTAGDVELFSSRLGEGRGGGPLHEVLATAPLGVR